MAKDSELAYLNVEVLDENGWLVPNAEVLVEFKISGSCKLQAIGNGNPTDMKSFRQPKVNTFRGRCQLILRLEPGADEIKIEATSPDLFAGVGIVPVEDK